MALTEEQIWQGVLIGGVVLAGGSLVLDGLPKPRQGEPTGAPPGSSAPVPAVGGVTDYVRIYLAQRIQAQKDNGALPAPGANGKVLPVTPRLYAVREVVIFWAAEIERLIGLDKAGPFAARLSLTRRPRSVAEALGAGTSIGYRGIVSIESADLLLQAWDRAASQWLVALAGNADPLSHDDTQRFWDATARIAIDVDVDRATPDFRTIRHAWGALVDSVLELPGTLGEAARDAAAAVGGAVGGAAWSLVKPILFSPLGIGAAMVAAYWFRAELGALARRVRS